MRLPPLNALLAFHLAGKHESFLLAAEEQGLTPGAISRHVSNLEENMGVALFARRARGVSLTAQGRILLAATTTAFQHLHSETERISAQAREGVRFRCSMVCMRYWLMPRLPRLYAELPDLDLNFVIARSTEPMAPELDCAIRIGNGFWPNFRSERLMSADLIPVAAPAMVGSPAKIRHLRDLRRVKLIQIAHTGDLPDPWRSWLGDEADAVLSQAESVHLRGEGLAYQAAHTNPH